MTDQDPNQRVDELAREFLESVGMGYWVREPDDKFFTYVQYVGSLVFEQDVEELKALLAQEVEAARDSLLDELIGEAETYTEISGTLQRNEHRVKAVPVSILQSKKSGGK